ncbi:fructose-1,6-bisphosphatase, class II [Orenia metallireducens]|uniref:Fructose-1,6-bisphosphatase n=1 Tax=Orenia metallireducens TaxID=1413210 RepID=A0A1C0A4Y2_9FIRM|nr:class II fructose-bisphosphatase [Orenia metallireducens]OCL25202.1 fructose-1,6-bisphosphatase, class II [Orenia metallireducens]
MRRELELEIVKVTEAAALAVSPLIGKGDKILVDQAAVDAMREEFNKMKIRGRVVMGEGKKDKAPMLYTGEKVGLGTGCEIDIVVDPVEGTNLVIGDLPNALAVVAIAKKGKILSAPDMYMKKIAVGPEAKGVINLEASITENIKAVADAKNKRISDIKIIILNRPRHQEMIREAREVGAKVKLINAADVVAGVAVALANQEGDLLYGIGGAPEGVLTAAALKCLGGDMQGQLVFYNDNEIEEARQLGIKNINQVFTLDNLVSGEEVIFSATGITNGELLKGVQHYHNCVETNSIVMNSQTNKIRNIKLEHRVGNKFHLEKGVANF